MAGHPDGVDRQRLRRYAQVCGYPDGPTLPPTYPHILAWREMFRLMRGRDFPLPLIGLVHVGNVIEQMRPLSTEDNLCFAVRWENLRDHERGQVVDVVTEATVDGDVVWRERSSYLRRSRRHSGERRASGPAAPDPLPVRQTWPLGVDITKAYARVSGDRNPIHTSALAARLFGFPGRIAHGMWSAARCLAAMADRLPGQYTVDVAFKVPVVLPATVVLSGDEHRFRLYDERTGRPHLDAEIRPVSAT